MQPEIRPFTPTDAEAGAWCHLLSWREAYAGLAPNDLLGGRLLEVGVGERAAYLWVFEGNERALGFYRRHGFVPDGATHHDDYFDLGEIRLVRS
ncbi:hypothetical protein PWY87_15370 [Kribbella solani]|uniref:GNAT family N-acetyltransferase n=1 Tax=Kribbella solani TaxID=236067 RepID=UPI0029BF36CB|nr:hypothetical protein [Kribbella solani]MDX3003067.1 hypothetical protein [Kribbella solani]